MPPYIPCYRKLENARRIWPFRHCWIWGQGRERCYGQRKDLFELDQATLVEQDHDLIAIGQKFYSHGNIKTYWQKHKLQQDDNWQIHDLVTLSYMINELSHSDRLRTIRAAWQSTGKIIAVIEPGTKQGYANILSARDELIALGGYMIAQCPHSLTCSMIKAPLVPDDWCHFPARVERSALHRRIKDGSLAYEDEKFSYIVMAKEPVELPRARIVRHPANHKGHVNLDLCVTQRIERETVSRKQKDIYQRAKKRAGGDAVE